MSQNQTINRPIKGKNYPDGSILIADAGIEKVIGPGHPTYIVAELSANHNQSYDEAVRLIRAAKETGVDAVKLQTYTADTITIDCQDPRFQIGEGSLWTGRWLHELYAEAYTPWEWQPRLKALANELGMQCFSSPFDATAVDFLEEMNVPAYKIASFELVDLPLIAKCAATGKPIIMSTGMATLAEIHEAVSTARQAGATQIILLRAASAYPAPPEEMNLKTIPNMRETFGVLVGLSDHTMGNAVPVAAVALGACMIEKHFTLSREAPGPDSKFSMEPGEFREMVEAVRVVEKALGRVHYEPGQRESGSLVHRRSLWVVEDVRAGETFSNQNVRSIRPAGGLHTRHLQEVVGKTVRQDVPKGTPLAWDLVK